MRTWIKAVMGSVLLAVGRSQANQDFQPLVDAFESLGWAYWPITPWTWELHQTLRDPPVWVDFSQLPPEFAKRWDTSQGQLYGVKVLSVTLCRDILTRRVVAKASDSGDQLAVIEAGTSPQLRLQLDEDELVLLQWRKWLETQDPAVMEDWYGPMHPPAMVLHTVLADIRDRGLYEKNVAIAEAEAERAARTRAESARQAAEERKARSQMLMMMGQGGYSVTNELQPFAIFSIQSDTNGWMIVQWESASTHLYEVQAAPEMTWTTAWQNVAIMIGGDGSSSWTDTNAASFNHRFYRVRRLMFTGDEDGDGVSNIDEFNMGTNLRNIDTDGDGIPDGQDPNPLNPSIGPPTGAAVSLYNAYGIYTNGMTNIYLQADARSTNAAVTVVAAEYFHSIVSSNGGGIVMGALDGTFNSTNETVTAIFTPAFAPGERHILWLHAQGSDGQWGDFVKVIINPNINDILDKIQVNYSAFQDMQFDVTTIQYQDGVAMSTNTVTVKMKGPYKIRSEYDTGFVGIQNENQTCWYNDALNIGGAMTTGLNGDFSAEGSRCSDFFWDVPLAKTRTNASISNAVNAATFDCPLLPKSGVLWPPQQFRVDFAKGVVQRVEGKSGDVLIRSEYLNPTELLPGHWLFMLHRHTMQFDNGDTVVVESSMSNIRVNQGLADSLFNIPTE